MSKNIESERRENARSGSPDKTKTAIAASMGTMVENYDFLAYATASALYFGTVFFPDNDPVIGTLLAFATLAVGFVVRPLGGIIGGYMGDRYGRKPVLVTALVVMGVATAAIGLLPTYENAGILAPILLLVLRVVQGLSFGAEWGSAVTMTYEHAPWRRRGFFTSIPLAGGPLGVGLASIVFLASASLPGDWAWRVPFLASTVLIVIGLIIRVGISETPEFTTLKKDGNVVKNPLAKVLRENWRDILRIIAMRIAEGTGYYVIATYLLSYVTSNELVTRDVALTGSLIGSAVAVCLICFIGRLSDTVGRKPIYIVACLGVIAYAFPAFALANSGSPFLIALAFVIGIGVVWAMFGGAQGAWFSELFSTGVRSSGASLGYQLAPVITGFSPFIAALLAAQFGWVGPALLMVLAGLIGLVGVLTTRETWGAERRAQVDAFIAGVDESVLETSPQK
ncbi:MFS transporter [Leifsonia kafniensis]|uniref:MFS transporter n=1 Tax=Leifsonia kafniensis TaxID=475957 RepID=A0ABP7KRB7_9MICO